MERIFLDTGFIIALVRPADENHERAKEINKNVTAQLFLSDHIFDEVLTFLGKHKELEVAYEVGKKIIDSEHTEIFFANKIQLEESLAVFNRYKTLSLCDALSVILMKNYEIQKIISFDSDFDLIPGIERIH